MSLKRYRLCPIDEDMVLDDAGDYVLFDDVMAASRDCYHKAKKEEAMSYFINRNGERTEICFSHGAGPKNGKCQKCGEQIKSYDSYFIDRNTGEMYCPGKCGDWALGLFILEHGFHYYTDG